MTTNHSQILQQWSNGYLEAGRKAIPLPEVHAGLHWDVEYKREDWQSDDGIISIGFSYESKWESELPFPEPIEEWEGYKQLRQAFTEHEAALEGLVEKGSWDSNCQWTAPKKVWKPKGRGGRWEAVGHYFIASYNPAGYQVPFGDLPLEIQQEREQLRARYEKMNEIKWIIGAADSYLRLLTISNLEQEACARELQEKLTRLLECHAIAKEVTPSTYKESLRQFQDHVLAYLGLPADAPEPEGGAQGIPSNKQITVARRIF